MRIVIVTDAWPPQVNGVVRTITSVGRELRRFGHEVLFLTPEGRKVWRLPSYPEIEVSLVGAAGIGREIDAAKPEAIHIATEGPLGWAARRACLTRGLPFTTSFHTRFAEYAAGHVAIPGVGAAIWAVLRHFHKPSRAVMVPTPSIARLLEQRGFSAVKTWTRGVDHGLFNPQPRDYLDLPRPIILYAGRIVADKNIEAFLKLDLPGSKVIVGEGPGRKALEQRYPTAMFTGYLHETNYARALSAADVLVFPSLTDTFGLVMIEAMACGTPVAAFNVPSPVDVVQEGVTGSLDPDLARAIGKALRLDRNKVHEASLNFTWERTARMFESWLAPIGPAERAELVETTPVHLR